MSDAMRIAVVVTMLLAALVCAAHAGHDDLGGPAFTDPDFRVDMPEGWRAQPIEYEDWAAGADIAISLDQHLYPVLLNFIREYEKAHGLKIAVKEGTCGVSAGLLGRKAADITGFCCPAGKADRLPGLEYHTVGIGPIAIIVHPTNPMENVTLDTARAIFSGEYYDWGEVKGGGGGFKGPIHVVGRLHCKERPGHWRLLLDNEELFSPSLIEVGSIDDMVLSVSEDKSAVGHLATWNIHAYGDRWKVKALNLGGVSPYDGDALARGGYPLYRPYNITTWSAVGARNPEAEKLVKYLLGRAGDVDKRFGMVTAARLRQEGWKFRRDELVGGRGD